MGTNCPRFLVDIFLYSYEAEFIVFTLGWKETASQFNFTYRYIDDILSINNPDFENYIGQIYPAELGIKDTAESNTSASYFDLLLSIGREFGFALPFSAGVLIPASISQTFLSWVAMFHLRRPTVFVSWCARACPSYQRLFWERRDCHKSFSGRDVSRNVWGRPSEYSMVDIRISSNIMKSFTPNVTRHSGAWSYALIPSIYQTFR